MSESARPPDDRDTDVLGRRVVAATLDGVFGGLVGLGTGIVASPVIVYGLLAMDDEPGAGEPVGMALVVTGLAVATVLVFGYFVLLEWRWDGRTLGKSIADLRVVTERGETVGLWAAVVRTLLRPVDAVGVGLVLVATSDRRQRLGDRLAGTVVVGAE